MKKYAIINGLYNHLKIIRWCLLEQPDMFDYVRSGTQKILVTVIAWSFWKQSRFAFFVCDGDLQL